MLAPTMTLNRRSPATGTCDGELAEHTMVLQQCWARSLSWRMLRIHDAGLSDEQRALVKGLELVWAPDINPRLKRTLLTFKWWRNATSEEARLVSKFFPIKHRSSGVPALLAA
jgi:hypothetical protein